MDVGLHAFYNFQEFDYAWYSRAADMFLTLREALGEEKYVKFLQTLYRNNAGKIANEQSLNEALAESLGLKTGFFSQWLHEPYKNTQWNIQFEKME